MKRTQRLWNAWILFLERLYTQIRYTALPVADVIKGIDRGGLESLAWLEEFRSEQPPVGCPETVCKEERTFAATVFGALGTTDLDGQLLHIEQCLDRAKEMYERAAECVGQKAKAYAATGICGGLCVGLLLL